MTGKAPFPAMRELFIYFRAAAGDEAQAARQIHAMQGALRERWPGLRTRCLRRPEAQGGLHTWMEVYASAEPAGVTADIEASIAESAGTRLAPLIVGERHVEAFVPCAA